MFAGLMSRWTMPLALAASSADAICSPRSIEWPMGIGRPEISSASVRALEQLHGDEGPPFVLADFVDRADVRVVERGGRARFARKAVEDVAQGREAVGKELERDLATELQVGGAIDHAHATAAELLDDLVVSLRGRRSLTGDLTVVRSP